DGVEMQGNFGTDADSGRDNFTAIYPGSMASGYTQISKITGAFRRTNNDLGFSMLDYAMASVQGTSTEFDSMRRLYRLVSQHLRYTHFDIQDDSSMTFIGYGDGSGFSLNDATVYSKAGTEMPSTVGGQCHDYGTILAALARTSGIVARTTSSQAGLGGWADHYFTEAYIPDLPHHGGKAARTGGTASDTDPWYVFDATDPRGSGTDMPWGYHGESIAPRVEYGRAKLVMWGPPLDGIWDVVTTKLGWNPLFDGTVYTGDVTSLASAYSTGPEFWLTASGVTGWIGYGDKDVYRISKSTTGAKAVRVRSLPSGGEYIAPLLCLAPVGAFPVMSEKCATPMAHQNLPAGESYVVVFNDTPDVNYSRILRGDSIQYVLELEY
ncbi:MAG TPA: transglutaminase domain-containing protein, partial [Polyangiaceae bacterium]